MDHEPKNRRHEDIGGGKRDQCCIRAQLRISAQYGKTILKNGGHRSITTWQLAFGVTRNAGRTHDSQTPRHDNFRRLLRCQQPHVQPFGLWKRHARYHAQLSALWYSTDEDAALPRAREGQEILRNTFRAIWRHGNLSQPTMRVLLYIHALDSADTTARLRDTLAGRTAQVLEETIGRSAEMSQASVLASSRDAAVCSLVTVHVNLASAKRQRSHLYRSSAVGPQPQAVSSLLSVRDYASVVLIAPPPNNGVAHRQCWDRHAPCIMDMRA
ncbi:uncharacterized protein B0H18DRAFT_960234 [Fomitopsis serialis]|uniref:uncharacterized protein n=1 Tax=Fomitopsis serialis TaxID=139415 RepID=UPI0020075F38|nr:uncharacterized protein B0H18DRAFT_960234 [Neoantrodia serialis]KAH9913620.1 hypothetical protein B0H18DRAFT_960234 [Neoantrodia serialis]